MKYKRVRGITCDWLTRSTITSISVLYNYPGNMNQLEFPVLFTLPSIHGLVSCVSVKLTLRWVKSALSALSLASVLE